MSSYLPFAYNILMIKLEDEVKKKEQEINEELHKIFERPYDLGNPEADDNEIQELVEMRDKLEEVKDHIYDDHYKKALSVFKSIDW